MPAQITWFLPLLTLALGACAPAAPAPGASGDVVIALPGAEPGGVAATRPARLRVIGINDFHGHVRPIRPHWAEGRRVGGAAALAAYFAQARAAVDAPTVVLDAGDTMQGAPVSNLTFGRATIDFYNAVGVTAAAIGNHEFDWGVEVLKKRIAESSFPWLGANIYVAGSDTLPSWVRATSTVTLPGCAAGPPECDSVRVGIIGIATSRTPTTTMPSHVAGLEFGDEAAAIDRWVPVLREEGADFVLVTAHEGAYCPGTELQDCHGPMIGIVNRVHHRPDLIVSGHTHSQLDIVVNGVRIVQSGDHGTRFTIVDLERVATDSVAVHVRAQPVTYVDEVVPDPAIAALVAEHERTVGDRLHEVVTRLDSPLIRSGPEYPLGNLIADAQRHATGADVAIMNNGGIRRELAAGDVTYEDLVRVQPFANTLVTMTLDGTQLLAVLDHVLRSGRPGAHVSGVRVRYRPDAPTGSRVVAAELESGDPILPDRSYRVTANNFMVDGGDGFAIFRQAADAVDTGIVDVAALIEYLRSQPKPLRAPAVGRFTRVASPARGDRAVSD